MFASGGKRDNGRGSLNSTGRQVEEKDCFIEERTPEVVENKGADLRLEKTNPRNPRRDALTQMTKISALLHSQPSSYMYLNRAEAVICSRKGHTEGVGQFPGNHQPAFARLPAPEPERNPVLPFPILASRYGHRLQKPGLEKARLR
jgi:hypothetical protein